MLGVVDGICFGIGFVLAPVVLGVICVVSAIAIGLVAHGIGWVKDQVQGW